MQKWKPARIKIEVYWKLKALKHQTKMPIQELIDEALNEYVTRKQTNTEPK